MGVLSTILGEIDGVLRKVDEAQVDAFAGAVVEAPRVFVTGEGRSGLMAKAFAMRLMHLGLTVYVIGETITPPAGKGDLMVAVSGSGTTAGTAQVAQAAQKAGAQLLAVTTDDESPLGKMAARTLLIPAATKWRREGEAKSQQPLGSLFDQCCHIALDAVCLRVAELQGETNETARLRHANVE